MMQTENGARAALFGNARKKPFASLHFFLAVRRSCRPPDRGNEIAVVAVSKPEWRQT